MNSWGICNFLSSLSVWSLPAFLSWQMSWLIPYRLCSRSSSWERAPVSYPGSPNKSASENDSMQKCGIHGSLWKRIIYLPSLNKLKYSWLVLILTLRSSQIFLHFIVAKSLKETEWVSWICLAITNIKQLSFPKEVPQRTAAVLEEIEHSATKCSLKLCVVAWPVRRLLARVWMFTQGDERT